MIEQQIPDYGETRICPKCYTDVELKGDPSLALYEICEHDNECLNCHTKLKQIFDEICSEDYSDCWEFLYLEEIQ